MAYVITQEIQGNECIGDSRIKINNNFDKLDTVVVALSTNTITVSATDTILHTYTPTIRRLASNVKDNSIQAKHLQTDSVTTAKLSAGAVAQSFGNTSGAFNFRNKIINGNFDIWQRGTSFTNPASNTYLADRWKHYFNGTGATRIISQQLFDSGQTAVPNEPIYFLRYNQSVAGTGGTFNVLEQPIESVRTFAGKRVTVSFYAKANTTITLPTVNYVQYFGTGGTPTASRFIAFENSDNVTVTTSWQKFTFSAQISSINGTTLGSDNNDYFGFRITMPINTTYTVDIAQVQVEEGPVATPFEQRPIGLELSLCQRYYCKSFDVNTAPAANINTGYLGSHEPIGIPTGSVDTTIINFPVTMRTTPLVTFYNPFANTALNTIFLDPSTNSRATVTNYYATQQRVSSFITSAAFTGTEPTGSLRICYLHYTADAEF